MLPQVQAILWDTRGCLFGNFVVILFSSFFHVYAILKAIPTSLAVCCSYKEEHESRNEYSTCKYRLTHLKKLNEPPMFTSGEYLYKDDKDKDKDKR